MEDFKTRNYELFEILKSGDLSARDSLCEENLGLVRKIVFSFSKNGELNEDLMQIGTIGLIKAIDNFDLEQNVQFSTYAVPMILGEIKRFLRDDGIIKVSRSLKQIAFKGFSARERLEKKLMREPTIKEISEESKISVEDLTCAFDAVREPDSLNKEVFDDSKEELEMKLQDNYSEDKIVDKIFISGILKSLSFREQQILLLRYYKGKTQDEISKIVGVSQVQVSRIEKKAIQRIRETEFV